MDYRPDVDGLRAVAIIPVILFHMRVPPFGGGYVGVDIFFVISGFLITKLVITEIDQKRFSFAKFYERRARRLFPALFSTVLACLVLSPVLFVGSNIPQAAGSAVFALASLSNVFFWTVSGYFDTDALTKPLLHTWSLSVEEQFYLVWPAALLLSLRVGGKGLVATLVLLASGISLGACIWVMTNDVDAPFYLMPFRIFEFGAGAVVVGVERYKPSRYVLEALLAIGLGLIAVSVFNYTSATRFPGVAALLPCVGAALAIYAGRAPLLGNLLCNRIVVGIGLISYSLYLIHWPVIVFFDAYFFREPTAIETICMIAFIFILSGLSYRFIEMPFRRPNPARRWTASAFGLTCALLAIALIVPASWLWSQGKSGSDDLAAIVRTTPNVLGKAIESIGSLIVTPAAAESAPSKIPDEVIKVAEKDRRTILRLSFCPLESVLCGKVDGSKVNVLIIGDSHSEDAFNALATAYEDVNFLLARVPSCPPFHEDSTAADCAASNAKRDEQIASLKGIDAIVLHILMPNANRVPGYVEYINRLAAQPPKLIVMGDSPAYSRPVMDLYQRFATDGEPFPDFSKFRLPTSFSTDPDIRAATQAVGATFVDLQPYFCPDGKCSDYTRLFDQVVVADKHHLSWQGALEVGEYIRGAYPDLIPAKSSQ